MGAKEIAKACADCMAACEVCAKAIDSGDIDATVKAATACAAACDACETACGALTGAPPEPADEAPPVDPATNAGVPPVAPPPAAMAANSALMRLSCKATVDEALAEIATWRTSHLALEADRAKLATERGALENVARRDLVVQLVKLGAETPATSGMNVGTLCARLAGEPLAELRDRVVQLAARPPIKQLTPETESGLTPREVEMCRVKKIDPAQYAANRSAIRARSQSAKQES